MAEAIQYQWAKRQNSRGVVWYLAPVGVCPILNQIACVGRDHMWSGKGVRWRASCSFAGKNNWWSGLGATTTARACVERWLSHKVWEWDGCEIVEESK